MQACLLLHGWPEPMLLDCGATSLVAMKRSGVDPNEIGVVALSHLHGDHSGGLPFLILDGQFTRRTRPLLIAGPPGVQARVGAAMEVFFPGSTKVTRRFETRFEELVPGSAKPTRSRERSATTSTTVLSKRTPKRWAQSESS
jgi:ribonuclease BN (tRNA processing enzyme)